MSYVCLELAQANDGLQDIVNRLNVHAQGQVPLDPNVPYMAPPEEQRGEHGANVVRLENHQERLFFFHVDSCLAIIFLLNNDMAIGGHAGMNIGEVPDGEPEVVIRDMQQLIPHGADIVAIHLVGDFDGYPNINQILNNIFPQAPQPVNHQIDNPVNVVVSHHLAGWDVDILPYVLV